VHPITAVRSEYSLWTRQVERIAPVMAELGVGLVPYSPLGRGFLTGTVDRAALDARDFRSRNERFHGAAWEADQAIADTVRAVAASIGAMPAQVALAWVSGQSDRLGLPVVPIPGTRRAERLEQNVAALDVTLDDEAARKLASLGYQVVGGRRTTV
jgi:aryl-alcohol dehydrogenase-like predicted oxidoreductase